MKKLIFILILFCIGCSDSQLNKYKMIMTQEMLDSYVGKDFIPVLDSTFNTMGLYGRKVSYNNPKYEYFGYVDSTYYKIYFDTDVRGLILSYKLEQCIH